MKREYTLATQRLIDRMCRNVEREDFVLDKVRAEELILKTYDIFKLPRPKKIVWCVDIYDEKFARSAWSAWSARSARSAWSAWSAGSAWSARSARSARSAWSAGSAGSAWSARSAGSAALDYDFDWFVMEYEYCKNPDGDKPNDNDKIYLKYCDLLIQAIEAGLGYRVEWEDTLYLVPDRLCKIDEQNRFHSLTGPAIWWKDGKEFYFVNGVSVSKKIVMTPEKLTKKDWLEESNAEVRRIIQERMVDFPKKVGAKTIQRDLRGALVEIELKGDPEKVARYVKVNDSSTKRVYYLRVPPTTKTASEGVSWTFNLDENSYQPIEES